MRTRTLLLGAMLTGSAACSQGRSPDAMTEEERSRFFLTAVRDSGYICADLMMLQRIADDGSAWRISCTDLTAYLAAVEPDGSVTVSLAPYVEAPARGRPAEPLPPERPPFD